MKIQGTKLVAAVGLLVAIAACGRNVGDPCGSNVECSSLGDRFCDLSAPQGYCTVEGCDNSSCPVGAVCIRFFTTIPTRTCNPASAGDCRPSERCLCDCGDPTRSGGCLVTTLMSVITPDSGSSPEDGGSVLVTCGTESVFDPALKVGHCAPESSERRWCQRMCTKDQDCRAGYECRASGSGGSAPVPNLIDDGGVPIGPPSQFCVQRGR